jgi:hypothetical protein
MDFVDECIISVGPEDNSNTFLVKDCSVFTTLYLKTHYQIFPCAVQVDWQ